MSDEPKKKYMFKTGVISRHPSQSTPKNPKSGINDELGKNKPRVEHCLRYMIISTRHVVLRCTYVGWDQNWLNCCTMNVMSDL